MDTVRGATGVGEPFREIVDAEVVEDYQPRHLDEGDPGPPHCDCIEAPYQGRHRTE